MRYTRLAVLLALVLTACAKRAVVPTAHIIRKDIFEQCEKLDHSATVWAGIAAGFGVAAGSTGIGTLVPESDGGQLGLGITSVVTGVFSAVTVAVSQAKAKKVSEANCSEIRRKWFEQGGEGSSPASSEAHGVDVPPPSGVREAPTEATQSGRTNAETDSPVRDGTAPASP